MIAPSFLSRAGAALLALQLLGCGTQPTRQTASADPTPTPTPSSASGVAAGPRCERLPTLSNNQKVAVGGTVGGILGGIIGASVGERSDRNVVNGVLGGALVGALAGSAFKNEIDIDEQPDGSVRLRVPGSLMFASGQYSLSPAFQSTLASVTQTLKKYCDVSIRVVGHTDSVGQAKANQLLSEKRAQAVQSLMVSQGFDRLKVTTEGRGDTMPRASNQDEVGRQQNRRVEIFAQGPTG
ncbi:OmpA family protein [Paucibacter sp. APW11]|uniref:OmpA family protein n=1 Tax=Roseateles aquae TaxID=3077235 RepID=A0ABU3PER1_9BURK|nr:OmpA family protein [Paucibacter sp. APW11]MDT9000845.1 OmpA family protein [Paucibacter sp. APW11]